MSEAGDGASRNLAPSDTNMRHKPAIASQPLAAQVTSKKRKAYADGLHDFFLPRPKWPRSGDQWTQYDWDSAMMVNTLGLDAPQRLWRTMDISQERWRHIANGTERRIKVSFLIQALDLIYFDPFLKFRIQAFDDYDVPRDLDLARHWCSLPIRISPNHSQPLAAHAIDNSTCHPQHSQPLAAHAIGYDED